MEAKRRLAEMNSVMDAEEQAAVEAIAGMGLSLRAAAKRCGMSRKKLEAKLKSGLDKLAKLNDINDGAAVTGTSTLQ